MTSTFGKGVPSRGGLARGAFGRRALACGVALAVVLGATAASAQTRSFDIPAEPAVKAIPAFAQQAGVQIIAPARRLKGVTTPAIHGQMDARAALALLLKGTGLEVAGDAGGVITLRMARNPQPADLGGAGDEPPAAVGELIVTGTRIHGAPPASPLTVLDAQEIKDSGLPSLGDVVRALPQNFASGQNPGVVGGAAGRNLSNQNISGGSALDLRGLGPDATLTLLNGRRLSYDGFSQAVDVSMIPLAAIQQLQVVTDGASAIYGSDAVAGVANIILKPDMQGLTVTGRIGAATDGGDVQRQVTATTGARWSSGGFIVAFSGEHDSAITASQRAYTSNVGGAWTILPPQSQYDVVLSGHQALNDWLKLDLDAVYAYRTTTSFFAYSTVNYLDASRMHEFTIAPTLEARLPGDWTASLGGEIGRDEVRYYEPTLSLAGAVLSSASGCYCDASSQIEANAEGPLFSLPAGKVRAAIGGGWRENDLRSGSVGGSRISRYVYGEANAPLVSPEMGVPGVRRLSLDAAVRYERYADIGAVATPKVGVIWSPLEDVDVKASWGQSFKAPTLLQQHQAQYVAVFPASSFGTGYPSTAQALLVGGGSLNLKPERANTGSVTATWRPSPVPGLKLEATWFEVAYRNRVVAPIATFGLAFSDPIYAHYVTYNPTSAQQAAVIATAAPFYSVGPVYDASSVVAIIDNAYANATRQNVSGVDLSARYTHALGAGSLQLIGSASWLRIRQQVLAGQAFTTLTGTVFNPPAFRGRLGAIWSDEAVTLGAYVNHQSGLTNLNVAPAEHLASQTTLDLSGAWRPHAVAGLKGLELSLAVQNLFDATPPHMTPLASYIAAYDSANYSAIGRFISLTVSKTW